MSSVCAAALMGVTWALFHGALCYQAEITNSDNQVVAEIGVWNPPKKSVYLTVVVSAAISELFLAQRLGELNKLYKVSCTDMLDYYRNFYQHGKKVIQSILVPAELLVVSRIINFVHHQMLKFCKDWRLLFNDSSLLLDDDYNERPVMVYHTLLSVLTLGLYAALFSFGFFNNKSELDVAFLAFSPLILSPTLQVVISHVLEGLKEWVESAARSPSSRLTYQRSQRITLSVGLLAAIVTGIACEMPGNVLSNNAFVGAFMSTETPNYHNMMGDLGPSCFFFLCFIRISAHVWFGEFMAFFIA